MERFSSECGKTTKKVTIKANKKKNTPYTRTLSKSKETAESAGKRWTPSRAWVLLLHLIGGESGACFLPQSQNGVKHRINPSTPMSDQDRISP